MSEIRTHRHSLLVKLEVHMDTLSSSPIARSCFGRPSSLGAVLRCRDTGPAAARRAAAVCSCIQQPWRAVAACGAALCRSTPSAVAAAAAAGGDIVVVTAAAVAAVAAIVVAVANAVLSLWLPTHASPLGLSLRMSRSSWFKDVPESILLVLRQCRCCLRRRRHRFLQLLRIGNHELHDAVPKNDGRE